MARQVLRVRTMALILIPLLMIFTLLVGAGGSKGVGISGSKFPSDSDKFISRSAILTHAKGDVHEGLRPQSTGSETNWFFGFFGELHFNTGVALPGNAAHNTIFASEASVTQSDSTGNLLFYSDGRTIWNNLHALVNGGLNGGNDPVQALSVPDPADPNPDNPSSFYLISMRGYDGFPNTTGNFGYTKVSVSGSNLMLSSVNTPIAPPTGADSNIAEMVTAVPGCGNDYWIIVHGSYLDSNPDFKYALFVYQLTAAGVGAPAVYPIVGPALFGQLKASPDGTRVAYGTGDARSDDRSDDRSKKGYSHVLDFNRNTGVLSNPRAINRYAYGVSFSPNSQLLYLTETVNGLEEIFQYDLNASNLSEKLVADVPVTYSALQLGPDNKIYVALDGNNHLAVINSPDERNTGLAPNACGYSFNGPLLNIPSSGTSVTSGFGLPNMIDTRKASSIPADFSYTISSCSTASFLGPLCASSYLWNFGDSTTSNVQNPTHTYAANGTYTTTLSLNGSTPVTHAVTIGLAASLANIFGASQVCLLIVNPPLQNYSAIAQPGLTYQWTVTGGSISGSSSNNNIDVVWSALPGSVQLTVTDPTTGCSTTKTLTVTHNCGQLENGQLVISRFRENGPAGAGDEFVEIFNPGGSTHTVASGNGSGYGVFASAGNGTTANTMSLVCRIPDGTVIPARGYFLCSGTSYSLGNLGRNGGVEGATAVGDAAMFADIPNDAGLALINVSTFSTSNFLVFDSVGFAAYGPSAPAPLSPSIRPFFCEGTCLQPVGDASTIPLAPAVPCPTTVVQAGVSFPVAPGEAVGSPPTSVCYGESGQYEFLRRQTTFSPTVGTLDQDTNNNAADFILVSPNPSTANIGSAITGIPGVTSVLGAAGPHNLSAPPDLPRITFTQATFDDCGGPIAPRNAERVYALNPLVLNTANDPLGTFTLRLRYTNNSASVINGMRFRVDDLSTLCGAQALFTTATGEAKNLSSSPTCQGGGTDVGVFTAIVKVLNSLKETVVDCHNIQQTVNGTVLEDLSVAGGSPILPGPGALSPFGGGIDNSLIVNPFSNPSSVGDGVTGGTGVFATVVGMDPTTKVLFIRIKLGLVRGGRFKLLVTPEGK